MVSETLKVVTQEEFDIALERHWFYLRTKKDESQRMVFKNRKFDDIDLMKKNITGAIFDGSDFTNAKTTRFLRWEWLNVWAFYESTLDATSFRNSKFAESPFLHVDSMKGVVLIGAEWFGINQLQKFDSDVIMTEEEYKNFILRQTQTISQQEQIIEIKDKAIEVKDKAIEVKDEALQITKGNYAQNADSIFHQLQTDYSFEEKMWFIVGMIPFVVLLSVASVYVSLLSIDLSASVAWWLLAWLLLLVILLDKKNSMYTKHVTMWMKVKESWTNFLHVLPVVVIIAFAVFSLKDVVRSLPKLMCSELLCTFSYKPLLGMIPLVSISIVFLWFVVKQYAFAKKLRIEQQNRRAMASFMQLLIAADAEVGSKHFTTLVPFFGNAIIHRPFSQDNYDPQLPIDEIAKVADLMKSVATGK